MSDTDRETRRWEDVLADMLKDPEARADWERTAPARALANVVIGYRIDHNLTQTGLARRIGMSQPAIARLEIAEHVPTIETLIKLSRALGVGFRIQVLPDPASTTDVPVFDIPTDIEADLHPGHRDDQLRSAAD